ncbi:MAG: enoyl-CoA hydratase/isomerase family protein [Aquisalimonadaceae bacterium]
MIHYQTTDGITTIRLDRPKQRNALSTEMIHALGEALAECRDDRDARCVVLTGSNGHFCAGRELGAALQPGLEAVLAYDEAYSAVFRHLQELGKPSVAVVEGYAVAGGFSLAMGCDFVLATEGARFGAMEMHNAFPAAVNTALLSHLGSPRLALEWLMSGDLIPARRLYEQGLINRIAVDADALTTEAQAFTGMLASRDPVALRLAREAFRATREMPLTDALTYGKNLNALLLASGRIEEAAQAFKAKQSARARRKDTD